MRSWRHLGVVLVLIGWSLPFLPAVAGVRAFVARDLASTAVPWRLEWRRQVSAGTLPVWNPAASQGRLLAANPNSGALYPATALFLVFGPEVATAIHLAFHHLAFVAGVYVLVRRAGGSPEAATVAAACSVSGTALSMTTFLNSQAAFAWLPWLLATAVPVPRPSDRCWRALGAGAALGAMVLAGEPMTAILAAGTWVLLVLLLWGARALPSVVAAAIAAGGVSAPVVVPLLASMRGTVRGAIGFPAGLGADALGLVRLPEILFPHLLGPAFGNFSTGFWADPSFPWIRYYPLIFVGAVPLLLLLAAARRGAGALKPWWMVAGIGFAAAAAMAIPAVARLAGELPLLGTMRYGIKFLQLAAVAVPVLVAAGWDHLAARWSRRLRSQLRLVAMASAVLVPLALVADRAMRPLLASLYPASGATLASLPAKTLGLWMAGDIAALVLPIVVLALVGPRSLPVALAVVASHIALGRDVLATVPAREWAATPPAARGVSPETRVASFEVRFLRAWQPGDSLLGRYETSRLALLPDYGLRWGLRYVLTTGPDGLEPIHHETVATIVEQISDREAKARVAAALGAAAVLAEYPVPGWRSTDHGGRWVSWAPDPGVEAYLARRIIPAQGPLAAVQVLAGASFVPGRDAVVEGTGGARSLSGGNVRELAGPPHDRIFAVASDDAAFFVLQQSHMDVWKAEVDGIATPVQIANGCNIGVWVPPGRHSARLFIDTAPYRFGLAGPPCIAVLATGLFLAARRRRIQRQRR